MGGKAVLDRLLAVAGMGPRARSESGGRTAPYACQGCDATFEVQYHVCPECGGYSVEFSADERVDDGNGDDSRRSERAEESPG